MLRLPGRVDIQPGLLYNRPLMRGGGAVVHGLLSTSTYGAYKSVGDFWPKLVVGSCLTEHKKLDDQVVLGEGLTRLRDSAKALR